MSERREEFKLDTSVLFMCLSEFSETTLIMDFSELWLHHNGYKNGSNSSANCRQGYYSPDYIISPATHLIGPEGNSFSSFWLCFAFLRAWCPLKLFFNYI